MTQADPIRQQIIALGQELGPHLLPAVRALFADEQAAATPQLEPLALDLPYGANERQKLDLYGGGRAGPLPVLLWVHGGGFVRGDRRSADHPFEAHIGRWAARHGFIGAVMSYRLAPAARWPSGGEDVAAAIDWLRDHAEPYGGDPLRIFAAGTSAGAVHIATALRLHPTDLGIRGAILLSGLYGFTPVAERDRVYLPEDDQACLTRHPLDAVLASTVPLFVGCAEFDPPRFQREMLGLVQALLDARGRLPPAMVVGGHNHYSMPMHVGTSDTRLSDAMLHFLAGCGA